MNKEYKLFKVGNICKQLRGKEASPNKVPDGTINMVNEISSNNGIAKKTFSKNIFKAPAITVSVNFAKNVFAQTEDFCASVNILILKAKWMELFPKAMLYFASVLRKNNEQYDYTHKISKDKLNETRLLLPSIKTIVPDWTALNSILFAGGVSDMNKIDTSTWKEFRLDELFDICKVYGKPFKEYQKGSIPYVTGTTENNGVIGYVSAPAEAISKGNCISVDPITGKVCYQPVDFVGRGFSGASINLLYNDNLNEANSIYICSAIQKIATTVASYNNLFNSTKLASATILLPAKEEYEPDWKYMSSVIAELEEERVAELEEERVAELEAYLQVTGLENYTLTKEDEAILDFFREKNGEEVRWKEFRLDELFDSVNGDIDIQKNHINGIGTDVISSGVAERGVIGKSDIVAKVIPANTITVDMFGNVFFRDSEYKMVTHARVFALIPKGFYLDAETGEYLEGCIGKLTTSFSYNDMCSFAKIADKTINLPVDSDGNILWKYIYIYIYTFIGEENHSGSSSLERQRAEGVEKYCGIKWKEFKLEDLFSFSSMKQAKSQQLIPTANNGIPYVVQSTKNNMVARNVSKQWLLDNNEPPHKGNVIVLGVTLPAVSYQEKEFGASQVIVAEAPFLNPEVGNYIVALLRKQMEQFSYSKKPGLEIYKNMRIVLPVTLDGTPAWSLMERYIKALEKLAIKDVVEWKDKELKILKEITA